MTKQTAHKHNKKTNAHNKQNLKNMHNI